MIVLSSGGSRSEPQNQSVLLPLPRRCRLAFLLSVYITVSIVLTGFGRVAFKSAAVTAIADTTVMCMFFGVVAECAHGGPQWLIAQLFIHIVLAFVLTGTSAAFRAGGSMGNVLFPITGYGGYLLGLGILYWVWSGICRIGALYDCMRNPQFKNERWRFRILIVFHTCFWFADLGVIHVYNTAGLENAVLYSVMAVIIVYSITPLALVHFSALSYARNKSMALAVSQATRRLEVSQAGAEALRRWFRVVFHGEDLQLSYCHVGLVFSVTLDSGMLAAGAYCRCVRTVDCYCWKWIVTSCCPGTGAFWMW
jgi:hypothetical protein